MNREQIRREVKTWSLLDALELAIAIVDDRHLYGRRESLDERLRMPICAAHDALRVLIQAAWDAK